MANALLSISSTEFIWNSVLLLLLFLKALAFFFPWVFAKLLNTVTGIKLKLLHFSQCECELDISEEEKRKPIALKAP